MQNFSSMPFSTLGSLGGHRPPDHRAGNEDSPEESSPKPETGAAAAAIMASSARLCFEKHETTGKMVARLKDAKTGEVIRQIPPEEMLKLAEAIDRYLGLLVDRQS